MELKLTSGFDSDKTYDQVHGGDKILDTVAQPINLGATITRRQHQIVQLVSQGYKNKEIAEQLRIRPQTVKNHLYTVFFKLGVSNRLELTLYAIANRWYLMDFMTAEKPSSP